MEKIQVIKEPSVEKPFLVIYKPKNLPSAPLNQADTDNALSQAIDLYPQIRTVSGRKEIEYGLLHRLDTPTDGLMVIAVTQEAYDYIQLQQKEGKFIKYYKAQCNKIDNINEYLAGFPEVPHYNSDNFTVESYFRFFGAGNKEVRPVTENSGKIALSKVGKKKLYKTKIHILNTDRNTYTVECKISEGFRHQVRCHLAWSGLPIINDELYNPDKKKAEEPLRFSATKLEFEYPKGDLNSYEITFTWT